MGQFVALLWLVLVLFVSLDLFGAQRCESAFNLKSSILLHKARIDLKNLHEYVDETKLSWRDIEANSESNNPLQIGMTPYQKVINGLSADKISLPKFLKTLGEKHFLAVAQSLKLKKVQLEVWPIENDYGQYTWVIARYRHLPISAWHWLSDALTLPKFEVAPELPVLRKLSDPEDFAMIFDDVLEQKDLYDKPVLSNSVFTDVDGNYIYHSWPHSKARQQLKDFYLNHPQWQDSVVARTVTQPPRFDEKPTSFVVTIENGKVLFDKEVLWTEARPTLSGKVLAAPLEFSPSLKKQYKQDVKVLAGEEPAVFPISKRTLIFERKNNIQTDHQLNEMTAYLKERYSILGLKTFEQSFEWRGLKHSNLIAVIPGSNKSESNKPVILADHFDTAFAEDVFAQSGQRVAAPGADDNYTATAALLSAAAVLKNSSPKHDIWLLHLTGEEFPADDLGARKFIEFMLEKKKAISGILLMDMIGHNPEGKKLFQINAGSSAESEMLGHISQQISKQIAPGRTPALRSRFSPYSYLYNTDGRVFSAFGFPVVLFNEHLNGKFRLYRDGYHMTNDDSSKIDWDYALDIFKVVTTTAVTVAHQD